MGSFFLPIAVLMKISGLIGWRVCFIHLSYEMLLPIKSKSWKHHHSLMFSHNDKPNIIFGCFIPPQI